MEKIRNFDPVKRTAVLTSEVKVVKYFNSDSSMKYEIFALSDLCRGCLGLGEAEIDSVMIGDFCV